VILHEAHADNVEQNSSKSPAAQLSLLDIDVILSFCTSAILAIHVRCPTHQAVRCHVDLTLGHHPEHSWKRRPGRPNNGWIDQLRRDNNDTPPADLWRRFTTRGHTGVTLRSSTTTHCQRLPRVVSGTL